MEYADVYSSVKYDRFFARLPLGVTMKISLSHGVFFCKNSFHNLTLISKSRCLSHLCIDPAHVMLRSEYLEVSKAKGASTTISMRWVEVFSRAVESQPGDFHQYSRS